MEQLTRDHLVNKCIVELKTAESHGTWYFVADIDIPQHVLLEIAQQVYWIKVGRDIAPYGGAGDEDYSLLDIKVLTLDDPRAEVTIDHYLTESPEAMYEQIEYRLTNYTCATPWTVACFPAI